MIRAARLPVIRNALLLVGAQVLVTPISVLVNAIAARTLGPVDYGRIYLAVAYTTFAFLFVEWGQPNVLAGKVATDRARAGELLGSGLVWRIAAALVAAVLLALICVSVGYDRAFLLILGLTLLGWMLMTIAGACQDALRGFERTDFAAASYVGWQLLSAAAAIPTLLLGGGVDGLLLAQALCAAAGVVFVLKMLPRMQVPKLAVSGNTVRELYYAGRPFLAFNVVLALQPMIDSAMLSRFASADSLGWYAAARKLIGILIYPAAALGVAAFPTLCRLHAQDASAFRQTAADILHAVTLIVMPVALGCALFPQIGIMIFSERSYGPAENDLRILALYVLLVYFSMTLSTCLTSSGRQSAWTGVQFACVIVSVVCDPPLIMWFQAHTGNGSLGVCVAAVLSELLMLGAGLYLFPKGILDRVLLRKLGAAVLAGAVMALSAWLLRPIEIFARALLAILGYFACLWLTGAFKVGEVKSLLGTLRPRTARQP